MTTTEELYSKQLDKLANYLLAREEIAFSDLVLDWYRDGVQCAEIAKPVDDDALKLALKASIIERMVEVFNSPPHNDTQTTPAWCEHIAAVDKPLKLQSDALLEDEKYCHAFAKRNLLVVENFMFFIYEEKEWKNTMTLENKDDTHRKKLNYTNHHTPLVRKNSIRYDRFRHAKEQEATIQVCSRFSEQR